MDTIHICIVQPGHTLAALPYLDHALYLQRLLGESGVAASIGKNRFKADRINLVLASHLGIDAEALAAHPCIIVNLERLRPEADGPDGAYLEVLRSTPVLETDVRQAVHYAEGGRVVPVLKLVGGLPPRSLRLEERAIGLLYQGPLNARTLAMLAQIERQGVTISRLDDTVHGPERQMLAGNARAVLQLLASDEAGFDLRAAAPNWWAGTPLIAERPMAVPVDPAYASAAHWFSSADIGHFFGSVLPTRAFVEQSNRMLASWAVEDTRRQVDTILTLAEQVLRGHAAAPEPTRLNACVADTGYRPGWLNLSPRAEDAPDLTADLTEAPLPAALLSRQGSFELLRGPRLDSAGPGLPALLGNAMQLLSIDGLLTLELRLPSPAGTTLSVLQAGVEEALGDATRRFWRYGWLVQRFELRHIGWLDARGLPLTSAAITGASGTAAWARVVLRKVETSYRDRARARACRQDFGLPDHASTSVPACPNPAVGGSMAARPRGNAQAPLAA